MTHDQTALHDRICELCTRVVRTKGVDLQLALAELAQAIELWQSVKSDDGHGSA